MNICKIAQRIHRVCKGMLRRRINDKSPYTTTDWLTLNKSHTVLIELSRNWLSLCKYYSLLIVPFIPFTTVARQKQHACSNYTSLVGLGYAGCARCLHASVYTWFNSTLYWNDDRNISFWHLIGWFRTHSVQDISYVQSVHHNNYLQYLFFKSKFVTIFVKCVASRSTRQPLECVN